MNLIFDEDCELLFGGGLLMGSACFLIFFGFILGLGQYLGWLMLPIAIAIGAVTGFLLSIKKININEKPMLENEK